MSKPNPEENRIMFKPNIKQNPNEGNICKFTCINQTPVYSKHKFNGDK